MGQTERGRLNSIWTGRAVRFVQSLILAFLLLALLVIPASAEESPPLRTSEMVRSDLMQAQLDALVNPEAAAVSLERAKQQYDETLSIVIAGVSDQLDEELRGAFASASTFLAQKDIPGFALTRSRIWTRLLQGAYLVVIDAVQRGDSETALAWLPVREFRQATRFSRPNADATIALHSYAAGSQSAQQTLQAIRSDLLDTYQARLGQALDDLAGADAQGFEIRRAEVAGLVEGYFAILLPAYEAQLGSVSAKDALQTVADLDMAALNAEPLSNQIRAVEALLHGFRAAPLSPQEETRRAGQMMRFLSLVPVEYSRAIRDGKVVLDLEIREAITFRDGAEAAFRDLESILLARNPALTAQSAALFAELQTELAAASSHTSVVDPKDLRGTTDQLAALLQEAMPEQWQKQDSTADFDVIDTALDQMEQAVIAGEYDLAESARLEAYAILESGPEARLIAFAPQYISPIENLFWFGRDGDTVGLAYLIENRASRQSIAASRRALDEQLHAAQKALGGETEPTAIALNAAIIVFREGLEAVVILAALMASMVGLRRVYRKPMTGGVLLAFVASGLTWWLMQTALSAFRGYGERLEAVVSLVAIGVLLVIMNWFFHRLYWTDWIGGLHSRKKEILTGTTAGQTAGFVLLGFTSVYREGFETVLFVQALVLEAGAWTVLQGVMLGLAAVLIVGWLTFKFQSRLPYKRMLVITGILIGAVLLIMVGNTVHILQVVGWMPIHPIRTLTFPFWTGLWLGLYSTWEGILLQAVAAAFVIGSYYLAEGQRDRTSTSRWRKPPQKGPLSRQEVGKRLPG